MAKEVLVLKKDKDNAQNTILRHRINGLILLTVLEPTGGGIGLLSSPVFGTTRSLKSSRRTRRACRDPGIPNPDTQNLYLEWHPLCATS
jgi:hypothetical protein